MCFRVSKTIIILLLVILTELIFIFIGINEMKEANSFEDIKEKITKNEITQDSTINKNSIDNYTNITNNIENKTENNSLKEEEKALEEYKNMPRVLKGYKVIRKNNNSKVKIR